MLSKSMRSAVAAMSCSLIAAPGSADSVEQVIVTATRASEGIGRDVLGSSVTVVEPRDIERRQVRVVSDVLRDVPGVSVSRAGPVGGTTQVRVRGAEGNQVLMLIDGMEVTDPYYGEFDFATLVADDVARIEVLRGQQSALYGSDAIGGVIHYMTLGGRDLQGMRARVEAGSFGTWEGSARLAAANGPLDYALNAGYQTTEGVPNSRFGTRDLGAENAAVSGRLQFTPAESLRVKAVARYSTTDAETNPTSFFGPTAGLPVDGDDHFENRSVHGLVRAEHDSFGQRWRNAFTLQGGKATRDTYDGSDRAAASEGSRIKGSYESSLSLGNQALAHSLTGAVDIEREQMQSSGPFLNAAQAMQREIDNTGLVAQYDVVLERRLALGVALRHDDNDLFKSATTYRVHGSYRFDSGTRLRASAGTGIKNPTYFELFGFDPNFFVANPNLQPERSQGWELGIEQSLSQDTVLIGAAYFNSKLKEEITTAFGSAPSFLATPINLDRDSRQRGIEAFGTIHLGSAWQLDAAYTYLDANEGGQEEIRRPPHSGSVNVGWRAPQDRGGIQLSLRYNGNMYDTFFSSGAARVQMPEFTLVNLGGDYRVNDALQLYARIENLLDEDYEEIYGFRTAGAGAYVGVRTEF